MKRRPTEEECWKGFWTRLAYAWINMPRDVQEQCIAEAALLGLHTHRERRSMYYFQCDAPEVGWPAESEEWVDTAHAEWPPDWNENDGTRL